MEMNNREIVKTSVEGAKDLLEM